MAGEKADGFGRALACSPPGPVSTLDAGDIVWLTFDPQVGREQAGHRPALVLSPANYNGKTGLMIAVPLTTRVKGYPFEVAVAGDPASVALADQVKCLDLRARSATRKGAASAADLAAVKGRLGMLIALAEVRRGA